jgi:hypothetical protein
MYVYGKIGGMAIMQGITRLWTRNPPEERLFCRNEDSIVGTVFPPGITNSWMRYPPEEG